MDNAAKLSIREKAKVSLKCRNYQTCENFKAIKIKKTDETGQTVETKILSQTSQLQKRPNAQNCKKNEHDQNCLKVAITVTPGKVVEIKLLKLLKQLKLLKRPKLLMQPTVEAAETVKTQIPKHLKLLVQKRNAVKTAKMLKITNEKWQ